MKFLNTIQKLWPVWTICIKAMTCDMVTKLSQDSSVLTTTLYWMSLRTDMAPAPWWSWSRHQWMVFMDPSECPPKWSLPLCLISYHNQCWVVLQHWLISRSRGSVGFYLWGTRYMCTGLKGLITWAWLSDTGSVTMDSLMLRSLPRTWMLKLGWLITRLCDLGCSLVL